MLPSSRNASTRAKTGPVVGTTIKGRTRPNAGPTIPPRRARAIEAGEESVMHAASGKRRASKPPSRSATPESGPKSFSMRTRRCQSNPPNAMGVSAPGSEGAPLPLVGRTARPSIRARRSAYSVRTAVDASAHAPAGTNRSRAEISNETMRVSATTSLDRFQLRNHVPDQRAPMERDVRIVREVVHDHDCARHAQVKRLALLRKASFRFRCAATDVPRDRGVLCDLVEDVHDLLQLRFGVHLTSSQGCPSPSTLRPRLSAFLVGGNHHQGFRVLDPRNRAKARDDEVLQPFVVPEPRLRDDVRVPGDEEDILDHIKLGNLRGDSVRLLRVHFERDDGRDLVLAVQGGEGLFHVASDGHGARDGGAL